MRKLAFLKTVGLKICENLLSSCPFLQVFFYLVFGIFPKSLFSKNQNLAFFKTELAFFSYKLLATLNGHAAGQEQTCQQPPRFALALFILFVRWEGRFDSMSRSPDYTV